MIMTNKRQSSKFETLLSHRILDKSINAINIFFFIFLQSSAISRLFPRKAPTKSISGNFNDLLYYYKSVFLLYVKKIHQNKLISH